MHGLTPPVPFIRAGAHQTRKAQRAKGMLQDRRRRLLLGARASLLEVHFFEKAGRWALPGFPLPLQTHLLTPRFASVSLVSD